MPSAWKLSRRLCAGIEDILFPPRCVTCGIILPPFGGDVIFCPDCLAAWDEARLSAAAEAATAATERHAYVIGYRAGQTDGIPERFIFHLKHAGSPQAFRWAAQSLALGVHIAVRAAETDAPLEAPTESPTMAAGTASLPPLYTYPPRRRAGVREDGFDQARRLARALARCMDGEFRSLLRRTRAAEAEQKALHADERRENAAGAYALRASVSERIRGRTVVLCDDLCTTGATLTHCTALLLDAGARCVVWATVAQTVE